MGAERGCFGGAPVERVGRKPGALILVCRAEAAGEREQLRLQMRVDELHVAAVRAHRHLQRGAAHQVHRARPIRTGRIVANLDRQQPAGERPDLDRVVQHPPAQERDPDPPLVRRRDRAVRHRGLERSLEPAKRRSRSRSPATPARAVSAHRSPTAATRSSPSAPPGCRGRPRRRRRTGSRRSSVITRNWPTTRILPLYRPRHHSDRPHVRARSLAQSASEANARASSRPIARGGGVVNSNSNSRAAEGRWMRPRT